MLSEEGSRGLREQQAASGDRATAPSFANTPAPEHALKIQPALRRALEVVPAPASLRRQRIGNGGVDTGLLFNAANAAVQATTRA